MKIKQKAVDLAISPSLNSCVLKPKVIKQTSYLKI